MKHRPSLKKWVPWALLCALVLVLAQGTAAGAQVETATVSSGDSRLAYPKLTGLANGFIQDKINAAIMETAEIAAYTHLMQAPGGTGVTLSHESWLLTAGGEPAVLSTVVLAEGKMLNARIGHRAIPMMFDLKTGERLGADALFASVEQAQPFFDEWVQRQSDMSDYTYIDLSQAVPAPVDRAVLTDSGLRLYYPQDGFVMLSGRTGAFDFHFDEIAAVLRFAEGSLIASLDVWGEYTLGDKTARRLEDAARKGILPGVPDVMGREMEGLVEHYKEMTDPEAFLGGEQYFLEAPAFRGVSLVVKDGEQTVGGILAKRANLYGMATGKASKEECVKLLGEGYTELPMDESAAEHYGMPEGTALTRQMGEYRLMLGFDDAGILRAIYLGSID